MSLMIFRCINQFLSLLFKGKLAFISLKTIPNTNITKLRANLSPSVSRKSWIAMKPAT